MTPTFFAIGYSMRSLGEFVDLLRASRVELVVDVQHIPTPASTKALWALQASARVREVNGDQLDQRAQPFGLLLRIASAMRPPSSCACRA